MLPRNNNNLKKKKEGRRKTKGREQPTALQLRSCQPGDGEPVPSVCGGAASKL